MGKPTDGVGRGDGGEGGPGGGATEGEMLPPGVTESDLLAACVGPDLDNITATAVLSELRNACLYLHYDGVRYAFKKDPNVTKLIEDAESEVARSPDEVKTRIREMLTQRLAGHRSTVVWPTRTQDLPDDEPMFLVGYLPLEIAVESRSEQERVAVELFTKYGDRQRHYRNGVALALPDRRQIEALRRAVRYLLAVERVDNKKAQLRLSKEQLDQLRERRRTEEAAAESAFRALYAAAWLPRVENGSIQVEQVDVGGRPLQATGIHERIMELLTNVGTPKVHASVTPRKVIERLRLGEATSDGQAVRMGIKAADVRDAFFQFLEPPRLTSADAVRKAIVRGVAEGTFAYTSGYVPGVGPDGRYQVPYDKVTVGRTMSEDEVDFESGFLIMPTAVPERPAETPTTTPTEVRETPEVIGVTQPGTGADATPPSEPEATSGSGSVRLSFEATRDQVFKAFPAIANLADKADSGKVLIQIQATSADGFDQAWLRNAVQEPLDEADIDVRPTM